VIRYGKKPDWSILKVVYRLKKDFHFYRCFGWGRAYISNIYNGVRWVYNREGQNFRHLFDIVNRVRNSNKSKNRFNINFFKKDN